MRKTPATHAIVFTPTRHAHQLVQQVELRSTPNPRARNVAVIGGGITGLTTAYQVARTIPHAKVTIYEKADRLGGWLSSEVIKVDDGEVLFEWGARTLRPDMKGAGLATIGLLVQLGIATKALCISKKHPAATNRFVYYPDHLVRMPGPSPGSSPIVAVFRALYAAFTEPIFQGVVSSLISEPAVAPRPANIADESVGDFLTRRFGKQVADNLASAIIHGIYAGDLYKLSARTLLPMLWYAETRDPEGNGIVAEFMDLFFKNHHMRKYSDVHFHNLTVNAQDVKPGDPTIEAYIHQMGRDASVYTFAGGVSVVHEQLRAALNDNPNVSIETGTGVTSLAYDRETNQVHVGSKGAKDATASYDYVVSTLSPSKMAEQVQSLPKPETNILTQQPFGAVTVMVVNLYYSNPNLIPPEHQGFGYLLPRSVPVDQNPERALGVIFGSETSGIRGPEAIREVVPIDQQSVDEIKKDLDEMKRLSEDPAEPEKQRNVLKEQIPFVETAYKMALKQSEETEEKFLRFGQDTARGTKLTVMLGGHWWNDWTESDLPTEDEAIDMAKSVLARQLKIMEAPLVAKARLNRDCIPQYPVGYRQQMSRIDGFLTKNFQGRLKVAGPWWQGAVGMNDCIRKARLTAFAIREEWDDKTGLEEYSEDEKYVIGNTRTGQVTMDPMQER